MLCSVNIGPQVGAGQQIHSEFEKIQPAALPNDAEFLPVCLNNHGPKIGVLPWDLFTIFRGLNLIYRQIVSGVPEGIAGRPAKQLQSSARPLLRKFCDRGCHLTSLR